MKSKKCKLKNSKKIYTNKLKKIYTNKLKKIYTNKLKNNIKEKLKIKLKPIIQKFLKKFTKKLALKEKLKNNKFRKSNKKFIQKGGGFADTLATTFQDVTDAAEGFWATSFLTNVAGVVAEVAVVPELAGIAAGSAGGAALDVAATVANPAPPVAWATLFGLNEDCALPNLTTKLSSWGAAGGALALGAAAGSSLGAVLDQNQSQQSAIDMYNKNKKKTNDSGGTANQSASNTKNPTKGSKPQEYPGTTPGPGVTLSPTPNPY